MFQPDFLTTSGSKSAVLDIYTTLSGTYAESAGVFTVSVVGGHKLNNEDLVYVKTALTPGFYRVNVVDDVHFEIETAQTPASLSGSISYQPVYYTYSKDFNQPSLKSNVIDTTHIRSTYKTGVPDKVIDPGTVSLKTTASNAPVYPLLKKLAAGKSQTKVIFIDSTETNYEVITGYITDCSPSGAAGGLIEVAITITIAAPVETGSFS